MLDIINAPNPVLSQPSKPVSKIDKAILNLVGQMEEALNAASDPVGVGLAAPQVGKSLSIFIAKPTTKSVISVFINPKIIDYGARGDTTGKASDSAQSVNRERALAEGKVGAGPRLDEEDKPHKLEGCLSLKDIWGEVQRSPEIVVEYLDETGKNHKRKFAGFMAMIIQHEVDHLNGVLFPKRVLEQGGMLYQSHKNPKGEDEFEELRI